jgi:hypothetical protein
MVLCISTIIKDYQDIIREMPYVPKTYFQRHSLGFRGDAKKLYLKFLSVTAISI